MPPLFKEEFRAEKLISRVRVVVYFLLLADASLDIFQNGMDYKWRLLPILVALVVSIIAYLEIHIFWEQALHKKNYGRYVKYLYISMDAIVTSHWLHMGLPEAILADTTSLPVSSILSMAFILSLSLFLILGILRFSPLSSLFTMVSFTIGYIIVMEYRNYYPDFESYIWNDSKYNISNSLFFTGSLYLGCAAAFVSWRLKLLVQRSKRQENLERFMPDYLAKEIVSGKRKISAGGKKQMATILFSDIVGFTSISEKESPDETINFLNTYLNDMINVVFHNKGTLDKIIGDGIMAIFGIPEYSDESAKQAVQSAIEMQQKLHDFNAIREMQNKQPIKVGIGIHTGEVIIGNVGSEKRMDFTAIGDTVNTASRLEGLTRQFNEKILISQDTLHLLDGKYKTTSRGDANIRGKEHSIKIYSIDDLI